MKINDPSLTSPASNLTGTSGVQGTSRTAYSGGGTGTSIATGGSSDDVHLSELVRSLRSLATGSPERQASLEQIARTYAGGSYQINAQATASKLVDDALQKS